jgi:hypothetical protein
MKPSLVGLPQPSPDARAEAAEVRAKLVPSFSVSGSASIPETSSLQNAHATTANSQGEANVLRNQPNRRRKRLWALV